MFSLKLFEIVISAIQCFFESLVLKSTSIFYDRMQYLNRGLLISVLQYSFRVCLGFYNIWFVLFCYVVVDWLFFFAMGLCKVGCMNLANVDLKKNWLLISFLYFLLYSMFRLLFLFSRKIH